MKKNITILFVSIILFGCINTNNTTTTKDNVVSFNQQQLLDAGWSSSPNRLSRDLSVDFGITPIYGIIDNYFDVRMGNGSDWVLKIIDLSKGEKATVLNVDLPEKLCERLGEQSYQISPVLTMLEIKGVIIKNGVNTYAVRREFLEE